MWRRIEATITIWSQPSALKVPVSALGREGEERRVFVVEGGRARRRTITIGQRNPLEAQVLSGMRAGERVAVHPVAEFADGVCVSE